MINVNHDTDEHKNCEVQLSLYSKLNEKLESKVSRQFFQDPSHFKSIHEVIDAIGRPQDMQKHMLLEQQKIVMEVIEDVVKSQHSNLDRPVKAMSDIVATYKESQNLIKGLRLSLQDARSVMSPTKEGEYSHMI